MSSASDQYALTAEDVKHPLSVEAEKFGTVVGRLLTNAGIQPKNAIRSLARWHMTCSTHRNDEALASAFFDECREKYERIVGDYEDHCFELEANEAGEPLDDEQKIALAEDPVAFLDYCNRGDSEVDKAIIRDFFEQCRSEDRQRVADIAQDDDQMAPYVKEAERTLHTWMLGNRLPESNDVEKTLNRTRRYNGSLGIQIPTSELEWLYTEAKLLDAGGKVNKDYETTRYKPAEKDYAAAVTSLNPEQQAFAFGPAGDQLVISPADVVKGGKPDQADGDKVKRARGTGKAAGGGGNNKHAYIFSDTCRDIAADTDRIGDFLRAKREERKDDEKKNGQLLQSGSAYSRDAFLSSLKEISPDSGNTSYTGVEAGKTILSPILVRPLSIILHLLPSEQTHSNEVDKTLYSYVHRDDDVYVENSATKMVRLLVDNRCAGYRTDPDSFLYTKNHLPTYCWRLMQFAANNFFQYVTAALGEMEIPREGLYQEMGHLSRAIDPGFAYRKYTSDIKIDEIVGAVTLLKSRKNAESDTPVIMFDEDKLRQFADEHKQLGSIESLRGNVLHAFDYHVRNLRTTPSMVYEITVDILGEEALPECIQPYYREHQEKVAGADHKAAMTAWFEARDTWRRGDMEGEPPERPDANWAPTVDKIIYDKVGQNKVGDARIDAAVEVAKKLNPIMEQLYVSPCLEDPQPVDQYNTYFLNLALDDQKAWVEASLSKQDAIEGGYAVAEVIASSDAALTDDQPNSLLNDLPVAAYENRLLSSQVLHLGI